jgi:hypothetical protein
MPNPTRVLQLRDPTDLLDAIPYLVGFHPQDSLVIVVLCGPRVVVTVRLDLDGASGESINDVLDIARRSNAEAVVLAVYDDGPGPEQARTDSGPATMPYRDTVAALASRCARSGVRVADALYVHRGRWWPYREWSGDASNSGSAGTALAGDRSYAAASATYAGLVALPGRANLEALIRVESVERRERLRPALAQHQVAAIPPGQDGHERSERSLKRALYAAARASDSIRGSRCTDTELARYAIGLNSPALRDSIWLAVDQGRLDGRGLWAELGRRLPDPHAAAPLFLYGWVCWREGNGALAGIAVRQALAGDPNYSAAQLLLSAIERGMDPFRTPRLRVRTRAPNPRLQPGLPDPDRPEPLDPRRYAQTHDR